MPTPSILSSAWEDLSSIADYLVQTAGTETAQAATDAILDAIALLETTPMLGPLHHDPVLQANGYRKLMCGRYVCVYRIVDEVPTIYRIFHSRQDYVWKMV